MFDGLWFTRHADTDDGGPAHPVRQLEGAGHVVDLRMPIFDGDHRKVTLDEKRILYEAMPWANAYRLVGEAKTVWGKDRPSHHLVRVEYCVADIEFGWQVPPTRVLEREFDLFLAIDGRTP